MCQATYQVGCDIGAETFYLQESYLGEKSIAHSTDEFRFSTFGEIRQQRVIMFVKKDPGGGLMTESRTDFINHSYAQSIDAWELHKDKRKKRRTRIINMYDNWVGEGQI